MSLINPFVGSLKSDNDSGVKLNNHNPKIV